MSGVSRLVDVNGALTNHDSGLLHVLEDFLARVAAGIGLAEVRGPAERDELVVWGLCVKHRANVG